MRKLLLIAVSLAAAFALIGCGGQEETPAPRPAAQEPADPAALADGIYFAEADEYSRSGWKYVVSLEVSGGEITWVDWNAVHRDSGPDKKSYDRLGGYQMVARGGAVDEWYVQAQRTEEHLLDTQDPSAVSYTSDQGHTDDISGVTIYVSQFFDLVNDALSAGPVGRGPYEDGLYYAAADDFSGSWKSTVALNVINGYITGINWSGVDRDGRDKKTVDRAGEYQMVARGGAIDEWYVQAERIEKLLLESQDPAAVEHDDDGYTDGVSGVTIRISDFANLSQKALTQGPIEPVLYRDGIYYAEEADYNERSGWKSTIEVMIVNGFIADVNWSALHRDGRDKKTVDLEGEYQMVARGGAIDEWHVQAARVEQEMIRRQDAGIPIDADGNTDAVSSVTITIDDFVMLAEEALSQAR